MPRLTSTYGKAGSSSRLELLDYFAHGETANMVYSTTSNKMIYCSRAVKKLTGFTRLEVMQGGLRDLYGIIHPADQARYIHFLKGLRQRLQQHTERVKCLLNFRIRACNNQWIRLLQRMEGFQLDGETFVMVILEKPPGSTTGNSGTHNAFNYCISERELEVLDLLGKGYSSKEIADKLCISDHTVISHRKNLIEKFKVRNTAHLIRETSRYIDV
ncbi:MAG: hypothetical protein CL868_10255 [Cytophagaceae bacterium]|nr:hypothetical protein [Cytophagaceae bacterium]